MAIGHRGAVLRQIERVFSLGTLSGMSEEQLLDHFTARHDEAAFEALIARHGPMVWGLCRRLLHDPHDAEDAFQATFLVLLRKAGTLREPGQLSPWLYGVAFRVASRVRSDPARRREKEGKVAKPEAVVSDLSREVDGLRSAIDEEVNRLPEKYRRPVILCHLEGLTYEEAARQLQWTTGMVKGRLTQARERLRHRLTTRGLAPSVGLAGPGIFPAAQVAVPQALAIRTAQVAAHIATAASASILALAEGAIRTMLFTQLKAAALVLAAGTLTLVLSACAFALVQTDETPRAVATPLPEKAVDPKPNPVGRSMEFRVVEPGTDRGIPGVQLTVRAGDLKTEASTDETGRYVIQGIPPKVASAVTIWATKAGLVPKSISWWNDTANTRLPGTYTLSMESSTTIGGLIRDEAGVPIEGAIVYIRADSGYGDGVPFTDVFEYPAKTDAQGRWRCDLIPAGASDVSTRLVHPDYVSDQSYGDTPVPSPEQLSAQSAVMVMTRGATLSGTVTDAGGRPIPGADVKLGIDRFGAPQPPSTQTDAEGHYQFHVKPGSQVLTVQAKGHAPDLKRLPAVQGRERVDFQLLPAQPFFGRIVDRQGRPVAGARIVADTWRGCRTLNTKFTTDAEGYYRWDDAPADEVLIDIWKGGYMPIRKRPMTASPEEVEIRLAPMLRVQGSVVDAESGQAVESFKVIPGYVIGDSQSPYWLYSDLMSASGGKYEISLNDPRTPHVRIEAKGFQPAVSRPFRGDEGDTAYDFKLQKAATITGIVRLPDGRPLPGAEVIMVLAGRSTMINNGRFTQRDRNPWVETGPDGRFSLPAPEKDYSIAVLHDRGYGERSSQGLAADPVVTVRPWGRIQGTYRIGSAPGVRQAIKADRRHSTGGTVVKIAFDYQVLSDGRGQFTLDHVPPDEFLVSSVFQLPRDITTASGQSVIVAVQPGETRSVSLGGKGQPVVGRIGIPKGSDRQVDWSYGSFAFETALERPIPPKGLDAQEQMRWWRESEESKAYSRAHHRFPLRIGPDGSFRVEDVPAAPYILSIQMYEPPSDHRRGGPAKVVGRAAHKFVVPEQPGGRSDEPLDLGEIPLNLNKRVGDPVSDF
ncbi:RNA polymerase sigma factor, sigma-70 family [Singulisphaera sp. GP187]|uniref:sigma-70 family RNA polymerase sigma factor n=1 Tax=Singulisphaera sp. GP187 TaxID=1882752 RepID=UPI0009262817|nr:sigma-70 family RNA polymerase sigma factor [Singulisphaera sp. GP187]SIO58256.1 RNA polymerase sigma factor, sigma-70 family [Singulisphaera sp. GP187]